MQQTTTLLSDELRKQIEELALHQHREPAEVLEDAVRRYAANYGLDRLSEDEFARFHALNAAYAERFGFPFIICVRLTDKAGILAAMARRLEHDRDTEIATAIAQIGEIVRLRLADMAQGGKP